MARDVDGGRAVVEVDAALDQKSVRAVTKELKTSLAAVDTSMKVEAQLTKSSVAQVKRDLKAALSNISVPIGISITKKSLADLRRTISTALEKAFQIDISVSKANIAAIKTQIRETLREETNVGVRVSAKDLATIRTLINTAIPDSAEVKVRADVSQVDLVATRLGRLFGRGARNNFFNLLGVVVEGAIRGVFKLGDVVSDAIKVTQRFGEVGLEAMKNVAQGIGLVLNGTISITDGFRNAANAAGQFGAGLVGSISNLPQLAATLGTLAAAMAIVSVVAGAAVATLYSLAGAATAVATALTGALVAGIPVAVAALGPLVAIVGSLAAAWILANKEQKDAFKQMIQDAVLDKLKDTILDANKILIKGLGPSLEKVGDVLAKFKPAILGVAGSLNTLGEEIANSLDSPEFERFQKSINEELPEDTLKLGRIFSDTFGGFGGVFVALQPAVDKFLTRLGETMQNFNTFANSASGKRSLSDFFLQGEEALGSLGRLIKETGRLFANMFKGAAGDEGISLIDSITGKIKDLTEYIKANPQKVREFFEGASSVARAVGDAIVYIVEEIGKLNTAANQDLAKGLFVGLVGAVKVAITPLRALAFALEKITEFYGAILEARGAMSSNTEMQEFGRSLRNFGEDAKLTRLQVNFLTDDIANLKGIGNFKLNAESSTITVATQKAKDLLIQSGLLKRYPEIKVRVNKKEADAANKALKDTKQSAKDLDGTTTTINVKVKESVNSLIEGLFGAFGIDIFAGTAAGGIMGGGKIIAGGTPIKMAAGGIVTSPTFFGSVLTGEAGPEAIVPLRRDPSQVHPSVRALSEFAQNGAPVPEVTRNFIYAPVFNGPTTGAGRLMEVELAERFAPRFGRPVGARP